jgi:hypothetical protein
MGRNVSLNAGGFEGRNPVRVRSAGVMLGKEADGWKSAIADVRGLDLLGRHCAGLLSYGLKSM